MEFIFFILISYGITNIIIFGSIFEKLRTILNKISPKLLGKLFSCPLCLSFWVGVGLSLIISTPITYNINHYTLLFLTGCLTSGCVWLIHTIQEFFERGFKD